MMKKFIVQENLISSCSAGGPSVKDAAKERWMELCEQALNEQSPERFDQIVDEIIRLLAEKKQRVNEKKSSTAN
jgi:hypothetical protein